MFSGFSIDNPRVVLSEQPRNRPTFWSADWYLVPEPGKLENGMFTSKPDTNYPKWLRENCRQPYDYSMDETGRRIFAFESDEEAILFKLTF